MTGLAAPNPGARDVFTRRVLRATMERRDVRFLLVSTLLAVTLLDSLGAPTAEWLRTASFALAYWVLLYVGYAVARPVLARLPAR